MKFVPTIYSFNKHWEEHLNLRIAIEWRSNVNGIDLYCLKVNGNVVDEDLDLELEDMPSSRTEEFYQRTRFPIEKVLKMADMFLPRYVKAYFSHPSIKKLILNSQDQEWAKEAIKNWL